MFWVKSGESLLLSVNHVTQYNLPCGSGRLQFNQQPHLPLGFGLFEEDKTGHLEKRKSKICLKVCGGPLPVRWPVASPKGRDKQNHPPSSYHSMA